MYAVDLHRIIITPAAKQRVKFVISYVENFPTKTDMLRVIDCCIDNIQKEIRQLKNGDDCENEFPIDRATDSLEDTLLCRQVLDLATFPVERTGFSVTVAGVSVGCIRFETEEVWRD